MFFARYRNLVYDALSFEQGKSAEEIKAEIAWRWEQEGETTLWGRPKEPNLSAIYRGLAILEREGLARRTQREFGLSVSWCKEQKQFS